METVPSGYEYYAWLASACLPSTLTGMLLEKYGDPSACHRAFTEKDPFITEHISSRFRSLMEEAGTEDALRKYRIKIEKYSVKVIRADDPLFPASLALIAEPPAFLFYQGDPNCLQHRSVAMVGSRAASYNGQKAAKKLAESLSRYGISIVSGMACGIDAAAHQGCIEGGSPTIAVTGCGLDRIYPADNTTLHDRILEEGGLILSEYAPGEKPAGWHFPIRNRIITGISKATILMEAKIRSGSMTSVQHALDQGKDVFVYPGDPQSEQFSGNHQLLREGGIYFTSAEDILEDMHWLDNPSAVRQNIGCSSAYTAATPEEKSVTKALKRGNLSFEQLLNKTGLEPSALMGTLTILQIRGAVESLPGKIYQIRH